MKIELSPENTDVIAYLKDKRRRAVMPYIIWVAAVMIIEAAFMFRYFGERINMPISALIWLILLVIPIVFGKVKFPKPSFEGVITDIRVKPSRGLWLRNGGGMLDPYEYKTWVIYNTIITVDIGGGKTKKVVYQDEKHENAYPYRVGDRVRYIWGMKYMQIIPDGDLKRYYICPFCRANLQPEDEKCGECGLSVPKGK